MTMRSPSTWLLGLIVASAFFAAFTAETVRPLRRRVESRVRRTVRNFGAGTMSLAVVTLLQTPFLIPFVHWAARHRVGLVHWLDAPAAVETVLAVLLLDYTLWHWHRWNHVLPFFWRFHLVHHVDRDMDASTALRFHFGEQALSVGFRLVQVAVIGASPLALWIWHALLFVSILFHHSNTRLPLSVERVLVRFIVTPRMHGIHHSDWRNETNSNWSSLLSLWDYLHKTALFSVPQDEIRIGVPAYSSPEEVTLGKILLIPFRRQKPDWLGPEGPRISRPHDPASRLELAP